MNYVSTRGGAAPTTFRDALLRGMAPDGGLYMPANWPTLGAGDIRAAADPSESWTAKLLASGPKRIAQKVGEEGVETALAGAAGDEAELASEAADLVYHLLVLLRSRGLSLQDVLESRA